MHTLINIWLQKTKLQRQSRLKIPCMTGSKSLVSGSKLTLQGLVEKAVYRYVNEEIFRNEMNSFNSQMTFSSSWSAVTSSLA